MDIMLVDDNTEILKMLSKVFSKYDQNTILFSDPIEAREYYKENYKSISLVISDYEMSEINGDELLLDLILINSNVRFMFYSGNCNEMDIDMSLILNIKGIHKKLSESIINFVANAIDIANQEEEG